MRKTIFWLHLIVGLAAGVVILVMSVTGVLLMYQKQITAWADGARISAGSGAHLGPDEILAKVRDLSTNAPDSITLNSDAAKAASVGFGREKTVFVNPYTGAIVGEGSKPVRAFFQSMIDWHRWLGMQGESRPIGKAITGACNLGFLFLVASGFYLWWPKKWAAGALRAVTLFDFQLSGKARDWNWHNVAGFWFAIPLFVLVFTAVFFSYPWATPLLYKAFGEEPPPARAGGPPGVRPEGPSEGGRGEGNRGETRERTAPPKLNEAFALAEQGSPGWKTISLRIPASDKAPMNFTVDRGNGARPDLRETLTIANGAIEKRETYESYNVPRKIRLWVRWLHTGEAGGFAGQTLAGVASGAGALLVWTGFALAWRRFFKRKAASL
jgi:uncharacterized iron-regulated membrane protein